MKTWPGSTEGWQTHIHNLKITLAWQPDQGDLEATYSEDGLQSNSYLSGYGDI